MYLSLSHLLKPSVRPLAVSLIKQPAFLTLSQNPVSVLTFVPSHNVSVSPNMHFAQLAAVPDDGVQVKQVLSLAGAVQ
jgi:hypothetical protein